ncbi:DUF3304 domain-containing protein [Xylophilus sp. GOD-11R]|uniref:DUF3304 domain-containing protein n=1 Tax=Xylophilus sp. GOD-11R TaxID=3089814 RepID=UPI00298BFEC3|nr:DUF3304 domain-containing protein [Xylophilus sp. GOD-11R]WPB55359.1 DUF3304 domain-containing protein [Xylophilus sp. GOD-11R]
MKSLMAIGAVLALGECAAPPRSTTLEERAYRQEPELWAEKRMTEELPGAYVDTGCTGHGNVGYIHSYAVREPLGGHVSRRMIFAPNCGETGLADSTIPKTWTPGMKTEVRWMPDARPSIEKTTSISRDKEVGMLVVQCVPGYEVRVVVTNHYAESPNHPLAFSATVPTAEPA